MQATDVYGYPCIGEEDYAGIPVFMKSLAEQIETNLAAQQDALEDFMDVGSTIWEMSAVQVFPDNFTTVIDFDTNVGGAGLTQAFTTVATLPALRGWYAYGASITLAPVGALDVGSIRELGVVVSTLGIDTIGTRWIGRSSVRAIGIVSPPGDALWVTGTVFHDGLSTAHVQGSIYHNQSAVDLTSTVEAPARLWAFFLGDSPDIREVG